MRIFISITWIALLLNIPAAATAGSSDFVLSVSRPASETTVAEVRMIRKGASCEFERAKRRSILKPQICEEILAKARALKPNPADATDGEVPLTTVALASEDLTWTRTTPAYSFRACTSEGACMEHRSTALLSFAEEVLAIP